MNLGEKSSKTLKVSLSLTHGYYPLKTISEVVYWFFLSFFVFGLDGVL